MTIANKEIFAANLQVLMRKKGVDNLEMATNLHISTARIREWLNAKCFPKHEMMIALCEYFKYLDIFTLITSPLKKIK